MVATTTRSISWLVKQLRRDYPDIVFRAGPSDVWSPNEVVVYYRKDSDSTDQILHELGHALLSHTSYKRDIELVNMERSAWTKAEELAKQYDITIDPESIESHMDSYRDWMHSRSSCTNCQSNGLQVDEGLYHCLLCNTSWKVNDARSCGLRRYTIKTK